MPRRSKDPDPASFQMQLGFIRKYAGAKYMNIIDYVVYRNGDVDENVGDPNELGWYGIIVLHNEREAFMFLMDLAETAKALRVAPLTVEEVGLIMRARRIIIKEDKTGRVKVNYFPKPAEGDTFWESIQAVYERYYEKKLKKKRKRERGY